METAKAKEYIRKNINGVYTINEHANGNMSVFTHNVIVTASLLNTWKRATGAIDIDVSFRADRTDGLVYDFIFNL